MSSQWKGVWEPYSVVRHSLKSKNIAISPWLSQVKCLWLSLPGNSNGCHASLLTPACEAYIDLTARHSRSISVYGLKTPAVWSRTSSSTLRLCISLQNQLALSNSLRRSLPLQTSGYGGQKLFQRSSMEESIPIKNDLVKSAFSQRAIGPNLLFEINSQTGAEGLRHQFTPPSDRKSVKTIRPSRH